MYKTAPYTKGFRRIPASFAGLFRQFLQDVEQGILSFVYDIHNGTKGNIACFKHDLSLGIDDGIIGIYDTVHKFLHDINNAFMSLAIKIR